MRVFDYPVRMSSQSAARRLGKSAFSHAGDRTARDNQLSVRSCYITRTEPKKPKIKKTRKSSPPAGSGGARHSPDGRRQRSTVPRGRPPEEARRRPGPPRASRAEPSLLRAARPPRHCLAALPAARSASPARLTEGGREEEKEGVEGVDSGKR